MPEVRVVFLPVEKERLALGTAQEFRLDKAGVRVFGGLEVRERLRVSERDHIVSQQELRLAHGQMRDGVTDGEFRPARPVAVAFHRQLHFAGGRAVCESQLEVQKFHGEGWRLRHADAQGAGRAFEQFQFSARAGVAEANAVAPGLEVIGLSTQQNHRLVNDFRLGQRVAFGLAEPGLVRVQQTDARGGLQIDICRPTRVQHAVVHAHSEAVSPGLE